MDGKNTTPWPHAPPHRLLEGGTYFVTASTYNKQHHFRGRNRIAMLHDSLLRHCHDHGWRLQAWAVFSNHYHFVAHCADADFASRLPGLIGVLHEQTSKYVNQENNTVGQKVWHNFWDTFLSHERSYLARLNYVHQNPVRYGLVKMTSAYPWCSASWFERTASPSQVKAIYRFQSNRVQVYDDYEPSMEW